MPSIRISLRKSLPFQTGTDFNTPFPRVSTLKELREGLRGPEEKALREQDGLASGDKDQARSGWQGAVLDDADWKADHTYQSPSKNSKSLLPCC